jgi:eukaryotic-like serine/threonine-protein kinase
MQNLIGTTTSSGWEIIEKVQFSENHTGGYFSQCFYVTKNNEQAFLKLLDISKLTNFDEVLDGLSTFKYESKLVKHSTEKRLSRVVRLLDSGDLSVDPNNPVPLLRSLPYLIFERGEGDIRETVNIENIISDKWRFCILHRVAAGLLQLHQLNIAHQDIKPSNILVFRNDELKIADLGRSTKRGENAPHDSLKIAGALSYAPFELSYSHLLPDWVIRRISTDVFHVGCLIVFIFTNTVLPLHVFQNLPDSYRPEQWGDPYLEVVPHLKNALEKSLQQLSKDFPEKFRSELISMVRDMCDPDPETRGIGGSRKTAKCTTLWLQQFVSKFDVMGKKANFVKKDKNV